MLNRLTILISRLIDVDVDPDVENELLIEFKDSMPGLNVMVEWHHHSITDSPAVWNQDLIFSEQKEMQTCQIGRLTTFPALLVRSCTVAGFIWLLTCGKIFNS